MMPPPAAKIRSGDRSAARSRRACRAVWPEENTGMTRIGLSVEHRRQAGTRRRDDAVVALAELVGEPVDVHVVGAGQPPELLPGDVRPAERRLRGSSRPSRCGGRGWASWLWRRERDHRRRARPSSGSPSRRCRRRLTHEIVPAPHLVDLAGEVEGEHDLLARSARRARFDHPHHRPHPLVERAMRAVGLQFVVLDEIDARPRTASAPAPPSPRRRGRRWA